MSTSTIRTDANNDLYLADGRNLQMIYDVDAVVQDVRAATLMRTGEDIYNVRAGVDYLQYVFTPQPSYDDARRSIINAIQASPDVLNVETLDILVADNVFSFEARIRTVYGQITVENQ